MTLTPEVGPASAPSRRRQLTTSALLGIGLIGLAIAARDAVRDSRDVSLPSPAALVACLALTRAALACSARAWVRLIGPPADRRLVAGALYTSQLVKYLPVGGLAQAAGQISMTATHGVPMRRSALAFASLAAATVVAGLTFGAGLIVVGDAPTPVRVVATLGLAAPALMDRRLFAAVLRGARRLTQRVPEPTLLPDQRSLWVALGWAAANHALYAGGFTVLLRSVSPDVPLFATTIAYVVAWVAGFLVLPLPAGVGVRELVLVALVPGVTAGPLLAASLAQRLVAIVAEVIAALSNLVLRRRVH